MEEIKVVQVGMHQVTDSEKAMLDLIQNKRFLDLERVPLICNDIAEIKGMLKSQVVTQDQFWPVKILTYSFVGLILTAVVGALLRLIILK